MKLTWLGHSCFVVEHQGYELLFDPYEEGAVPGLGRIEATVDQVLCSHQHRDHGAADIIGLRQEKKENPFTITWVDSFHDDQEGALRGTNRIHIVEADGLKVIHYGDIGCMPTREQLEQLRGADAVMIPVGGHFTMAPELIHELVQKTEPRVVVPMHYRMKDVGYPVIGEVFGYTDLVDDVQIHPENYIEITQETPVQTAVLTLKGTRL